MNNEIASFAYPKSNGFAPPIFDRNIGITEAEVKKFFNNPKYTLVKLFCELLTVFGHSVRRKEEFIECKICGDALPSHEIFNQLVERKVTNLDCWMIKCRGC